MERLRLLNGTVAVTEWNGLIDRRDGPHRSGVSGQSDVVFPFPPIHFDRVPETCEHERDSIAWAPVGKDVHEHKLLVGRRSHAIHCVPGTLVDEPMKDSQALCVVAELSVLASGDLAELEA
jgi:hypothetical protein